MNSNINIIIENSEVGNTFPCNIFEIINISYIPYKMRPKFHILNRSFYNTIINSFKHTSWLVASLQEFILWYHYCNISIINQSIIKRRWQQFIQILYNNSCCPSTTTKFHIIWFIFKKINIFAPFNLIVRVMDNHGVVHSWSLEL